MSDVCEGCLTCKTEHKEVPAGAAHCTGCACGEKHLSVSDTAMRRMIWDAHGLTWEQWLAKQAGHSTAPKPAIRKPKASNTPNKNIGKKTDKVEATLEGIKETPKISGTTSTHIDFTHGGLVEKITVARGATVSMKF